VGVQSVYDRIESCKLASMDRIAEKVQSVYDRIERRVCAAAP